MDCHSQPYLDHDRDGYVNIHAGNRLYPTSSLRPSRGFYGP
jgi:hypothetical protein